MDENIRKLILKVVYLSDESKKRFMSGLAQEIKNDKLLLTTFINVLGRARHPMENVERWMEKRFENNMKVIPMRVAHESLYYFKIDKRMLPLMIKIAQKVKRRTAIRNRRAGIRSGVVPIPSDPTSCEVRLINKDEPQ